MCLQIRIITSLMLLLTLLTLPNISQPGMAQTLQGNVSHEDYRIRRNVEASKTQQMQGAPPVAPPLRLSRPQQSAVDTTAFSTPLTGTATSQDNAGIVQSGSFAELPKTFDIGAERNSRELVLAWEKWHKQMAGEIYRRWSQRARSRGRAVMRITVYNNRTILAEMVESGGGQEFNNTLISTVMSLSGNPGLSFPAKSTRQKVSFEAEYIADRNVDPGYSWVKNDFEKVHQEY